MAKTALVVDDSATIRKLVSACLTGNGFTVIEAGNGKEALDKMTGQTLHLIVTDLNMPIMNGIEFIQSVRANAAYKFTPILFLTTESQEDKKKEAAAAGATGWLVKPFKADKMLEAVGRVVA
jgi:two-component system chemotaxis response regulator CheY